MPYIKNADKYGVDVQVDLLENSGHLNYALTMVIKSYLKQHGLAYTTLNDIVGALDGAKAEFQRRVVNPYEDQKIIENGDVYDVE